MEVRTAMLQHYVPYAVYSVAVTVLHGGLPSHPPECIHSAVMNMMVSSLLYAISCLEVMTSKR